MFLIDSNVPPAPATSLTAPETVSVNNFYTSNGTKSICNAFTWNYCGYLEFEIKSEALKITQDKFYLTSDSKYMAEKATDFGL